MHSLVRPQRDMDQKVECSGEVRINGIVLSSQVFVYLGPHGMRLSDGGKGQRSLDIYTFNFAMANALDHRLLAKPIEYSIAGTRLGGYAQQFGHPGEGDIDFRPIKRLNILITHDNESANYAISGFASGREGHVDSSRATPIDWDFKVIFRVPRESIARLYGLSESATQYFLEALSRL